MSSQVVVVKDSVFDMQILFEFLTPAWTVVSRCGLLLLWKGEQLQIKEAYREPIHNKSYIHIINVSLTLPYCKTDYAHRWVLFLCPTIYHIVGVYTLCISLYIGRYTLMYTCVCSW